MKNRKNVLILAVCLAAVVGAACIVAGAFRVARQNRKLEEQFEEELEESQKTISKLKEQENELTEELSRVAESGTETPSEEAAQPEPETTSLLAGILDREPGEVLAKEELYLDNPGIYFTAQEESEDLRYLKMPYYDREGKILVGDMVVNAGISQKVLDAFLEAFESGQQFSSLTQDDNRWTEADDWEKIKEKYQLKEDGQLKEKNQLKEENQLKEDDAVFVQE